jgi:Tfp pilus assembly protein PilN
MVDVRKSAPSDTTFTPNTSRKRVRTGVAISPTSLCAADVRLRGDRTWRAELEAPLGDGAAWPSLASALTDLARTLGVGSGTLVVSLMPPLTEVRRLDLPPVRADELQRLLARNAGRYFANARGPQVVGAAPTSRRSRNGPAPVIAAAASARLIAAIGAAAADSGWTIESIIPAEGAWAGAASALWPAMARQTAFAIVAHDDRTDVLQLESGRLTGVRRFRAGASDAPMIADTIGSTARAGIAGVLEPRRELAAALGLHGVSVSPPSGDLARTADAPDALAALFAESDAGPVLRSDDSVAVERERTRGVAWWIAACAAAVLVLAAGVQYWGVKRQLRQVQAERAQLRPQLSSTLIGQSTVNSAYAQLATLGGIDRAAPHWSTVIGAITTTIPEEAHLTALRTRDDSLVVDGLADHAARVFDALAKTRGLVEVKSAASVRRELQEQGGAKEHFTIAARAPVTLR